MVLIVLLPWLLIAAGFVVAGIGVVGLFRGSLPQFRLASAGPGRPALLKAMVLQALDRTRRAAESALAEEDSGSDALVRYLHAALHTRVSAIIPLVLDKLDREDEELRPARAQAAAVVRRIVDSAHADADIATCWSGSLAPASGTSPPPGSVSPELDVQLAHRHLDLLVGGLRALTEQAPSLSGPGLEHADLRAIAQSQMGPGKRQAG